MVKGGGGARGRFVGEVELVEPLAVEMGEAGGEALARRRDERDLDRPIFARLEGLDLGLALAHEAQRDGLHAAGRAAARQLPPQDRREREAHEVVERAAREIGLDQLAVEFARMTEGVEHGLLRHLVEDDALHVDAFEGLALPQHLLDVPGDGLALAVGVGREIEVIGAFDRAGDLLQPLLGLGIDRPGHREIVIRPHRAVLGRQVADMAVARQDGVALA